MYKKFLTLAIALIFIFAPIMLFSASPPIQVAFDGQPINFTNQGPVMIGYRTIVPVADVFNAMGFDVVWNEARQQMTLSDANHTVILLVGSNIFRANGISALLDVPIQIINNVVMAPIRNVVESVGYYVNWDVATNTVQISSTPFVQERRFIEFHQMDPRWRDLPFGSFTIGSGGCGPTAMAMAISTLHGVEISPCYVATWGRRFYVSGVGSSHALFTHEVTHRHFGLNFRAIPAYREQDLLDAIRDGAVAVISVQSRNSPNARAGTQGLFVVNPEGQGGHIAVIHGVTENGNVLMATPRRTDVIHNLNGWPLRTVRQEMHSGVGVFWVFTLDDDATVSFDSVRCHE